MNETEEAIETETLPLDAWHRAKGARMVPFAGYEMPIQYEGILAEHEWTRTHAGLFDVSHMGQLEISGDNAVAAIEAVLPIDLSTLKPGRQRADHLFGARHGDQRRPAPRVERADQRRIAKRARQQHRIAHAAAHSVSTCAIAASASG